MVPRPLSVAPSEFFADRERRAFLLVLAVVYAAALLYAGGLSFPIHKDEKQFWAQTQRFATDWPPGVQQLREYPEPMTPLSFLIWGTLERAFHGGIAVGRLFNVLAGCTILALIGLRRRAPNGEAALAALGLVLYPYFVPLSIVLYTDVVATLFVVLGLWCYARDRLGWSALCFVLGVSTRQYMVVYPTAVAVFALVSGRRIGQPDVRRILFPLAAGLSLLAWIWFFGGLAASTGLEKWPRHQISLTQLPASYILYFLTCIGAYFAVPEFVLFRRWGTLRELVTPKSGMIAAVLLILFFFFPPIFAEGKAGAFHRMTFFVLPNPVLRVSFFYLLAWFACVRFSCPDLGFWIILFQAVVMITSFEAWEKYIYPVLAALWFLRAVHPLGEPWTLARGTLPPRGG
jgi:hypothetical protein